MKKHNNSQFIFVLEPDGKPLMPTLRGDRVRFLLKNGQAKVVRRIPFTIQIMDESVGRDTQEMSDQKKNVKPNLCRLMQKSTGFVTVA